ncbi:hypothetical protein ABKU57_08905 [Enterobacter kobei]|uniref:hypothetical protein n=1 Tax=Enterobacter kobei TaxID=208224 RepID=UPI0032AF4C03
MSTITKEFTKEQLIEKLQHRISVASGFPESEKAQMDLELARIALASLEANSRKLFTCSACGAEGLDEPLESKCHCCIDGAHWVESRIYTAPQPLTTSERAELENYRNAQVVPDAYAAEEHRRVIGMLLDVCGAAFELADDSCQQEVEGEDCHVVPDASFIKLSDALDKIETTLPCEYAELPNIILQWAAIPRYALRYMLQGKADGNSPVIPDGWVLVPEEPTHEMLEAGDEQFGTYDVYRRMIEAAPQQK